MRILPLIIVMIFGFMFPIGYMISYSVTTTKLQQSLPTTIETPSYESLAYDLSQDYSRSASLYINSYLPGTRSMIIKTRNDIGNITEPYEKWFIEKDKRWADPKLWNLIKDHGDGFTLDNLKKALSGVYLKVLINTLTLGALITLVTLLIAYPTSMYLTAIKNKWLFGLSMFCILLPFFSSYLSRLVAWIVILPEFNLIHNTAGIFIGSVYILLPLCILPLYTVMKNIDYTTINAARICGADDTQTFLHSYLPQTKIGIINSALITFITVIGFYTTPALLGGGSGKFITEQIVYHIEVSLNWGLAAALTTSLTVITFILFLVYAKVNHAK
jgi:putative spermidine/putrescine transport system permease protein